jgi:hypothetical protein
MPHDEKPKKKRSHIVRNLAVLGFILLIVWFAVFIITTPAATDFQIRYGIACGHDNGMDFISITTLVRNIHDTNFHFTSEQIQFVQYILVNGTVVPLNAQFTDNNQTFNALHESKFIFHLNTPATAPKIASIEFVVTAHVQETDQPIVQSATEQTADIC